MEAVRPALEGLLDEVASRKEIHHAVMAVASTDGSFRWAGARGDAKPDGPPMGEEIPYFIASVDKLFTAVAVMALVEQRRLDLDAPLAEVLPPSLVEGLHRMNGRDRSNELTPRHLLGHTSGLASYLEDRPKGGKSFVTSLIADGDRSWTSEDVVRIVREDLRPHFPPQPPDAERPRVRYSDTNYALLHAVVEEVTGRPMRDVFREMLFEPLDLHRTWVQGATPPDAPEPAALWHHDRPLEIPRALEALDAIYSTVDDQLRFMAALVRGEALRDPSSFREMQRHWHRFGLPLDAAAMRAPSWPIEYGLGIKRFRLPRVFTGMRPLPELIGHSGSTGTWLFHCPELDLSMAGSVDQVTAGQVPYRLLPKVVRVLSDAASGGRAGR